jgi:hypothetical protein
MHVRKQSYLPRVVARSLSPRAGIETSKARSWRVGVRGAWCGSSYAPHPTVSLRSRSTSPRKRGEVKNAAAQTTKERLAPPATTAKPLRGDDGKAVRGDDGTSTTARRCAATASLDHRALTTEPSESLDCAGLLVIIIRVCHHLPSQRPGGFHKQADFTK